MHRYTLRGRRPSLHPRITGSHGREAHGGRGCGTGTGPARERRLDARARTRPQERGTGGQGSARDIRVQNDIERIYLRPGQALAEGDGSILPLRGNAPPAPGHRGGEGRHGAEQADGSPAQRRRRVRQDGGRDAGRFQGRSLGETGRGPRADDRPRHAALRNDGGEAARVPGQHRDAEQVRHARETEEDRRGDGVGGDRYSRGDPQAPLGGRALQGSGARDRRRGTPLRRKAEGKLQEAQTERRCPQYDGDADSENALDGDVGHTGHIGDRHASAEPPADPHGDPSVRRRAYQGCGAPRGRPRRAGLLRPQPDPVDRGDGGIPEAPAARTGAHRARARPDAGA